MSQDSARDSHAPQDATAGTSADNRSGRSAAGGGEAGCGGEPGDGESTDDASPCGGVATDEAGGGARVSPGDAARHRRRLVAALRRDGLVRSAAVAAAFDAVPRELFAPPGTPVDAAYADRVAVLAADAAGVPTSTLSQPSIVAIMLEQLDVRPGHRVLEIGTGSGYNTALLAELAGARGRVTSVELDPGLVASAAARLAELGPGDGTPMDLRRGDGWHGSADGAPYDRIHATVGVDDIAPTWRTQLADGGLLVAPLWLRPGLELSVALRRDGSVLRSVSVARCGFLQLRGPHAAGPHARPLSAGATGLWVVGEALSGADTETIGLLAGRKGMAAGPVPDLTDRRWWALTLSEPRTVLFTDAHGAPAAWGAYDAGRAGLVIAIDGWLTSHGDPGVADDVMSRLADCPDVDPTGLEISAYPTGSPLPRRPSRGATWRIIRRDHTYRIHWNPDRASGRDR